MVPLYAPARISSEASPLTAEVVVGLAGDVAAGWVQAVGVALTPLPGGSLWRPVW
jgi:hypothetical protein